MPKLSLLGYQNKSWLNVFSHICDTWRKFLDRQQVRNEDHESFSLPVKDMLPFISVWGKWISRQIFNSYWDYPVPAKIDFITRCWLGKLFAVWKRVCTGHGQNFLANDSWHYKGAENWCYFVLICTNNSVLQFANHLGITLSLKEKLCWNQY